MPESPSLLYRQATPDDADLLSVLSQACFLEAYAGMLEATDILAHCAKNHSAEKYREWLADPSSHLWLATAEPGGAPVGYLLLTTPDLPLMTVAPLELEIKRVYVLHRFHGLGIGRRLMEHARLKASALQAPRLLLCVYSKNHDAIGFYTRLGYTRVGDRIFQVGKRFYEDFVLGISLP